MQFDGGFSEISGVSGADSIADGRAFGWLDFNGDQLRDFVLVNANAPRVQLFENQLDNAGNSVRLDLIGGATEDGADGWSNRDAVGARLTVQIGGEITAFESHAGEGFASQNSASIIVGMGEATIIDSLTVKWPSGREHLLSNVPSGSSLVIRERQD